MNRHQPLYVTSPTHAMALWSYGILGAIGFLYILRLPTMDAIDEFLHGHIVTALWSLMFWLSGWIGLAAAISASKVRPPDAAKRIQRWLTAEMVCDLALAAAVAVWASAVLSSRGLTALASVLLGIGYLGGAVHRLYQIHRERPLLVAAASTRTVAEVLALPDDELEGFPDESEE